VSRCHAFIKKDSKGNVIIEDNQSKFGTLVQVKAPLMLKDLQNYYIQVGRTIMKISLHSEWNLINNLMKGNFSKKMDEEERMLNDPNQTLIGDYF
jgi:hypothetical protein